MSIQPEGEELRKAVTWIDAERLDRPDKSLTQLVEEAGLRFNLSPKESEYLMKFLKKV